MSSPAGPHQPPADDGQGPGRAGRAATPVGDAVGDAIGAAVGPDEQNGVVERARRARASRGRRRRSLRADPRILLAVALGGAAGSLTRYGIGLVWPPGPRGFPWATLTINVTGAMALGILVVLVTERFTPNRLLRPLLGTGFLGGYTTFSTFAVDTVTLTRSDAAPVALAYLVLTLLVGVSAAWLGIAFARAVVGTGRYG